jgi:hypothetical protein
MSPVGEVLRCGKRSSPFGRKFSTSAIRDCAAEIEEKFSALAEGVLSKGAQKKLADAIWNLEKVGSVSKLMALKKADVKKAAHSMARMSKPKAKIKKRR